MKPLVGSRRLLGGEGTLLEDTMGSTGSSSHFDSMAPMFLQSLAPSCTCLGKDSAAATRTPRAFQAREERARWPLSSGVRRWAWGSSSCRWRLPTAAWLSLGSWGWSSSETWVVPGWHAELLEMCPWVCSSFLQSTWERCICREAKKSMVRAGFPQGCSETQTSCQDPTHPWVPIQCSECPVHNLRTILCITRTQEVSPWRSLCDSSVTARLCGRPPDPRPWGTPWYCPASRTLSDSVVFAIHTKGACCLLMLNMRAALCSLQPQSCFPSCF